MSVQVVYATDFAYWSTSLAPVIVCTFLLSKLISYLIWKGA